MTNKQMKVFMRACDRIEVMADGNFGRSGFSVADFSIANAIMAEIYNGAHHADTISQNVADWFRKNRFNVQERGIGWTISLP